ncbi:hypothetical protein B484DRAFT_55146 [Ochromonadaceae sp. CCMP2298]|nr:hypothetical protein B484DRAFT_55146 [Ochromonadaceae sp. CCMP2298]|mmetsp:Transcript_27334/g.58885  ORF Transcript_27334/g.58885 Transcript_27334/m.58885 type:complete len:132 (+) Transcript_27334:75-470(+)
MSRKCFCVHVAECVTDMGNEEGVELFGVPLEFVWIQGVIENVIPELNQYTINDGTAGLFIAADHLGSDRMEFTAGDYVLVQGGIIAGEQEDTHERMVVVEARIMSRIGDPNMETLWFLEVIESMKKYGRPA